MARKKSPGRPPTMIPVTIHITTSQRRKLSRLVALSGRSMTAELRRLIESAPVGG